MSEDQLLSVALAALNVLQVLGLAAIAAWQRRSARSLQQLNGHARRVGARSGDAGTSAASTIRAVPDAPSD